MKYTYKTIDGNFITVEANDESEARHLAMEKRWADRATKIANNGGKYAGKGLELVAVVPEGGIAPWLVNGRRKDVENC